MRSVRKLIRNFKTLLLLILLPLSLLLNFYFLYSKNQKTSLMTEKKLVLRVVDGDTFDVEGDVRVRLAGADAPEYPEGCLSEQSKQRLTELLTGKTVTLEKVGMDNFGRVLAYTFIDNLFIDKTMLEEGLAYLTADNIPKYAPLLQSTEETAKAAERNIWSSACQKPPTANCRIKGNVRRDLKTKIYHLPDCFNYEKIVVSEKSGDRWFCSEREAQAAGFRRADDCPE